MPLKKEDNIKWRNTRMNWEYKPELELRRTELKLYPFSSVQFSRSVVATP